MSPDRWSWALQLYHDHAAMVRAQAETFSDLLGWVTVALVAGAFVGGLLHHSWQTWMRKE